MDVHDFIRNLEKEFDDIPSGTIKSKSKFKEVLDWSSINSVVLATMIEFEYKVILTSNDFRSVSTIEELARLIESKVNNG